MSYRIQERIEIHNAVYWKIFLLLIGGIELAVLLWLLDEIVAD